MSFEQETFGAAIAYMNQTLAGAGSLKGEKGDKGDPGEPGADGAPGEDGKDGKDGVTFTPSVNSEGVLSWTNDGGLDNPNPIKMDYSEEVSEALSKSANAETVAAQANTNSEQAITKADEAMTIAKGKNRARVFSTLASMQAALANESNKGLYQVGDNLYIVDTNVPDYWVQQALDEVDPDTGYFYKVSELETQKVDLTDIEQGLTDLDGRLTVAEGSIVDLNDRLTEAEADIAELQKPDIVTTTSTAMPGSYEGRLLFKEIAGKTEQLTSTGANVLEEVKVDASSVQFDGILLAKADLRPRTQYTISFIGAVGNKYYPNENIFEQAPSFVVGKGINIVTVTTRADVTSQKNNDGGYTLFKNSIVQPNANKFENVMMNFGSVALPYEPYGVDTPFIRSVSISGIKTHGKNIGAFKCYTGNSNYASLVTSSDISFIKKGKTYTISAYITAPSKTGAYWNHACGVFDEDVSFTVEAGTNRYSYTFVASANGRTSGELPFLSKQGNSDGVYITPFDVQIEEGEVATKYVPYGSSITLSQPIELNKIGDVQDVYVDGTLIKRIASTVLDGTIEPMTVVTGNNGGTIIGYRYDDIGMWAVDRNRNSNRVCDRLQPPTTTTPNDFKDCEIGHWGFNNVGYNDEFFIFCIDENFTTFSEVQTWLSTHPIRIVFEIVREYPDLPIADKVALNSIKTCDGTTHLEIDSPLEPDFKCEYGTSKVGVCTLEGILTGRNAEIIANDNANRIAALEATIVNNI